MKFIIIAILGMFSFGSPAQSIIKIHDGTFAECLSLSDTFRLQNFGVYKVQVLKKENIIEFNLSFLKCQQNGDTYDFVLNHNFEKELLLSPDLTANQFFLIQRKLPTILITSEDNTFYMKLPLIKLPNDHYSATFNMNTVNWDNIPTGKESLLFSTQVNYQIIDKDNLIIDNGIANYGSLRLLKE